MQRVLVFFMALCLWVGVQISTAPVAAAEFSFNALVPCSQSEAFQSRLDTEVSGYQTRLEQYAPGSEPAKYLEGKIASTKERFARYASTNLLCGEDGLPHLISDGRWDHAGEFLIPSLLFLYIAGWIGWVGRDYLRAIHQNAETAYEKEIILDVALATKFMLSGFLWPLAAVKELTGGQLTVPENEVTVSPR
ncbi:MAG: Photosystem I reaction center subunit III [Oscillatoriales cyanobacterium SM2_2_1]|nr:Photosystem I reaction center subunit III [Oscillatoriales cyanobacterium SM2_2_1]